MFEDRAMVSRIRVDVRGGTLKAAERAAFVMLEHARVAGLLEGIVPSGGEWADNYFANADMKRKPGDAPDPWSDLGLNYEGRIAFAFEPQLMIGGQTQFGFEVIEIDDYTPHGLAGHPGSEAQPIRTDVTAKTIVLHRANAIQEDADPPYPNPLRRDTVEQFEINVLHDWQTAVLPGWVSLKCTITETEETVVGRGSAVAISERYGCVSTVEEGEIEAEADRLLEQAQTYVSGILQGRTGARYFTATLEHTDSEESALAAIRGNPAVLNIEVGTRDDYWSVNVDLVNAKLPLVTRHRELGRALGDMLDLVGGLAAPVKVIEDLHLPLVHKGTVEGLSEENLSAVIAEVERRGRKFRTLLVGSSQLLDIASKIIGVGVDAESTLTPLHNYVPIRIDESLEGWEWVLTEEAVEPLSAAARKLHDERIAGV